MWPFCGCKTKSDPKILRVCRVSEENLADLGTKALLKAIISERSITLAYVNMAEERGEEAQQDVAMF